MSPHRATLLEGEIGPQLRGLSLPLLWGMMAMTLFTIAEAFFVSRMGTTALAALGFVLPVTGFSLGVIFGLTVGTTAVISRAYGEGDMEKVRRLATDSLFMIVLTTLAAAAIGWAMIDPLFTSMGATPELLKLIRPHMQVWYSGMLFMGLLFGGNACIRATGNTRYPSATMTLVAIVSITLDPFLIFGWGPFPEWGFPGAAAALVIANIFASLASLYYLAFRQKILMPRLIHPELMQSWGKLLHIGIPSMVSNMIPPLSAAVVTWLAADIGQEAVASLGVASRVESLAMMVFFSLGAGVSIFTGQNFGAGNYGRVNDALQIAGRIAMIGGFAAAALFWVFAEQIPALFDRHPLVIQYTAEYLRIVPVSYGAMGLMIISNAALNVMGKPLSAMMLVLLRAFVLYIPLAYVAEKYYGFAGILLALAVTNLLVGVISYLWNKIATP